MVWRGRSKIWRWWGRDSTQLIN